MSGLPLLPTLIAFFGLVGVWLLLGVWLHWRDEG